MSSSLCLPSQLSRGGLDKGDVIVLPLDGCHNSHQVEGLGVDAGEDDPLPGGDVQSISLPPQSSCGGPLDVTML